MNEEDIKRKMMQQRLQQQFSEEMQQQAQQHQMEAVLKQVRLHLLDEKARERLNNLKLVKPELAVQLEIYLAQMYQAGQIRGRITDEQMVAILMKLGDKKDFRIRRK